MLSLNPIKTIKGIRSVNCVNEAGLYKLIMRSDKPEAQAFQNWIASEVLPSIRKTGMYMTPEVIQEAKKDPSEFLEKALKYVKEALGKLETANKELLEENTQLKRLETSLDYR